jgi:hypothetical protein
MRTPGRVITIFPKTAWPRDVSHPRAILMGHDGTTTSSWRACGLEPDRAALIRRLEGLAGLGRPVTAERIRYVVDVHRMEQNVTSSDASKAREGYSLSSGDLRLAWRVTKAGRSGRTGPGWLAGSARWPRPLSRGPVSNRQRHHFCAGGCPAPFGPELKIASWPA